MRSRYRIGAAGALLCALTVVYAAGQALRDPLPVTSDVAVTCLPIVALLVIGAVLAWRAASQRASLGHA